MAIELIRDTPYFQLTNSQRACMGLLPVEAEWEWMRLLPEDREDRKCWVCFDGEDVYKRQLECYAFFADPLSDI